MRKWLIAALAFQAALLLWAVGPRLLPRLTGDEYRILVQPVDPIDPFRGAYVDLDYGVDGRDGWVPLERAGAVYRAGEARRERPDGPAIRCEEKCGIESFFASQDEARRLERELAAGGAVARVRIDGAGRAAIVALEPR